MGKGARIRRSNRQRHGNPIPDQLVGMSTEACLIAVSEMTGIPAGNFCNWALVGWSHAGNGHHLSLISPCLTNVSNEPRRLALLLERALADAEHLAELAGQ